MSEGQSTVAESAIYFHGYSCDNSDVYVLDMWLVLAGGVFETKKNGLHIGWLEMVPPTQRCIRERKVY